MLNELDKAIILATNTHSGDTDKAGKPYILHPLRVAMNVDKVRKYPIFERVSDEIVEFVRIACLLHDTVEDTKDKPNPVTLDTLRDEGYHERVIAGVDGMTKREGETYQEAIERAKRDIVSHMGKVCDLTDNMDLERLKDAPPDVRQAAMKRVETRYKPAIENLLNVKAGDVFELLTEMNGEAKLPLFTDDQLHDLIRLYADNSLDLTAKQEEAVKMALTSNVSLLDGTAGTGVTVTLKAIIRTLNSSKTDAVIHFYTATGKARNVLASRTGLDVKSIGQRPDGVIAGDLLIIYDPQLMRKADLLQLLKQAQDIRVLLATDLLMLADKDAVDFREVAKYSMLPITRLTETYRQH